MDLVIHPVEVATRKFGANGDFYAAYLSSVEIPRFLDFRYLHKDYNLY